jgi:hypothetical protein
VRVPAEHARTHPRRRWLLFGFAAFLLALVLLQIWAAIAFLVVVVFLTWFARLAIDIPAAPEAWKLNDTTLHPGFGLWVSGGLSAASRSQLPRWLLVLAFLLLWLSRLDSVRQVVPPLLLVAGSCTLAIIGFFVAFREPR